MAILDISGRSLIGATRLRGYKGDSKPKGKPHSGKDDRGGLLDFWLKPLEASGYDFEAIERLTGISPRHMRHVVAVKSRMELEAEKTCTEARKQAVRKGLTESAKARGLKVITHDEIAGVYEGTIVRKLPARKVAQEMGITMARLQTVRSLAKSRGQWPSAGEEVAS